MPRIRLFLTIVFLLVPVGCATWRPVPLEEVAFRERIDSATDGRVKVSVAALNAEESLQAFGVKLGKKGIQPVWLRIENNDSEAYWFLPIALDPDYFSPLEAAYRSHLKGKKKTNRRMDEYFYEQQIRLFVPPGGEVSGFVFTTRDRGYKAINVELLGEQQIKRLSFIVPVQDIRADWERVDFNALYSDDEIVEVDEDGLRAALEELPCCTVNKKGTAEGDPLNLAIVGHGANLFDAFIRRGWDETEVTYSRSAGKTVKSFLFGGRYRYSPISPLYVYSRPQDISMQKARKSIHHRNHLRLWRAPLSFEGKPVWIGQISRDIGVRMTSKTITTHKIDPDVDEARGYLIQDLASSQAVERLGLVQGVGRASPDEPRKNLTGDPYFTDGLRVVIIVSDRPTALNEIDLLDWEESDRER